MSFVAHTFSTVASVSTITPTLPSGIVATDKLIALVQRDAGVGISTSTSGWSALAGSSSHFNIPTFHTAVYIANGDAVAPLFGGGGTSAWKVVIAAFRDRSAEAFGQIQHSASTSLSAGPATATVGSDGLALWSQFGAVSLGASPAGWIEIVNNTEHNIESRVSYAEGLPAGSTGELSRSAQDFTAKSAALALLAGAAAPPSYFLGTDLYF